MEEFDEKPWILTNRLHFLVTYIWDAFNVNVNRTKLLSRSAEKCSNHEFLLEQRKNYWCGQNLTQRRLHNMEGHARKCVERYCELANNKTVQLYKVSSLCLGHHVKKEELQSVGELAKVCSHIVLRCCSFDFIHSSHKRLPTILSCGKHGSALSIGSFPRLRFCW